MKKNETILDVIGLSKYIISEYKKQYKKNISTIKLHKGLYFLFAFWGSNVVQMNNEEILNLEIEELKSFDKNDNGFLLQEFNNDSFLKGFSKYLFKAKIQAWTYGPVVTEVWFNDEVRKMMNTPDSNFEFGKITFFAKKSDKTFQIVKEFIDSNLEIIFSKSDFSLVERSHDDISWKKNFKKFKETKNPSQINLDEIIDEYSDNWITD